MFEVTKRIWRRAKEGDPEACSKLILEHYQPIYTYIRRLCGNTEAARDPTLKQKFQSLGLSHRPQHLARIVSKKSSS